MKMSTSFLLCLLVILVVAVPLQARNQSGFISISCGVPSTYTTYTQPETDIDYISDANFINTGIGRSIQAKYKNEYQEQLWNLRSFPEGTRNCYKINITKGSKYLIRAFFLYGNYDGLNIVPQFGLLLGPNWWAQTVPLLDASGYGSREIIHVPSQDYVQICMVNVGFGTPFISAIELRILENDAYVTKFPGSLLHYTCQDLGSPLSNNSNRYKDDPNDRTWGHIGSFFDESDWKQLSASKTPGEVFGGAGRAATAPAGDDPPIPQDTYHVPATVMSTAATPKNASAPLLISLNSQNQNHQFYFYMHFMEVEDLTNNQTREFNILVDGKIGYQNLVPPHLSTQTIYSESPLQEINIKLEKTQRSTHPPIINAIEIYSFIEFQQPDTFQEDVDAITTIKSVYGMTRDWQGDPCSPVDYLWDGINCTYYGNDSPRITTLNLSSRGLAGNIDPSISELTMLEKLDLSNNNLSGQIPHFLTHLQHLKILNLESNNLTGSIPEELIEKSNKGSLSLSVGHNPYICESGECIKKKKKKKSTPLVAALAASLLLIFVVTVAAMFWTVKKRKPKALMVETTQSKPNEDDDALLLLKNQVYSYSDVIKITNNFNTIIGKGGFGAVYLGYVNDTAVAVKMLSASSIQGYQQFQAEVKLLMRVHHINLTSLIGYCNEGTNKGLIYEYMANGNLQQHLSGKDNKKTLLSWEDRLRIATDAASGLEYLHKGCKPPIIHRDVKSSNILLTENFRAKISDFGLSKTIPTDGKSHVSTAVVGTLGYLDPDYYQSSRLTEKSDVYSFGIVLLELITSKPAIAKNHEKTHISQWVRSMVETGDIKGIVDSRLGAEFDTNSAWKVVETAMACVSPNPNRRPIMSEIVIELKECLATELARTKYNGANTENSVELVYMDLHTGFSPMAR